MMASKIASAYFGLTYNRTLACEATGYGGALDYYLFLYNFNPLSLFQFIFNIYLTFDFSLTDIREKRECLQDRIDRRPNCGQFQYSPILFLFIYNSQFAIIYVPNLCQYLFQSAIFFNSYSGR